MQQEEDERFDRSTVRLIVNDLLYCQRFALPSMICFTVNDSLYRQRFALLSTICFIVNDLLYCQRFALPSYNSISKGNNSRP
ncbi:MAG: hypothetical protein ACRC10_10580 [Thermoguttaceae bacterium]